MMTAVGSVLAAAALAATFAAVPTSPPSAPAASPAILHIDVVPEPVKLGQPVTTTVETTNDVVSVRGHVAMFDFNVPKQSDGTFSGTTTVPRWARFFHGKFAVRFVARAADGEQAQATASVRI
jgi:hypothetical protein